MNELEKSKSSLRNKYELEKCINDKNCNVIVVLPQTLIRNFNLLKLGQEVVFDNKICLYEAIINKIGRDNKAT